MATTMTIAKPTPASAPARQSTLAEVLDTMRSEFQGMLAYKRQGLARTRAKFDNYATTDLLYAIETYAGELAKHGSIINVWAAFEAAYLPDDATGATWKTLGNLANKMVIRLLSDAANPSGDSDPIRAGIEAQKAAGRAGAMREVRQLIDFAEGKIAHSAPNPDA